MPVMSLFRPYQIMAEIWRGSAAGDSQAWKDTSVPAVIGVWWMLFLIGGFLSSFGLLLTLSSDGATKGSLNVDILSSLAIICSGAALVYLVKKVTDYQEDRALLMPSGF